MSKQVEKHKKSTRAEILIRVKTVIKMIESGYPRSDIVEYGGKTWNIKRTQVDEYIKEARQVMIDNTNITAEEAMAEFNTQYNTLIRQSIEAKDRRTLLGAINAKADRNLGKPTQTQNLNIGGEMDTTVNLNVVKAKGESNGEKPKI